MIDYVRGSALGLATIFLASHAHPVIVAGFFVLTLINVSMVSSYFFRYVRNK